MYLSHTFRRYFEWNKNASPCSEQNLTSPQGSLITVFCPKVIVECVSKWITFPLSLSFPPSFLSFSLFTALFYFYLVNGLHMSGKWPWHRYDNVCSGLCWFALGQIIMFCLQYTVPTVCQTTCSNWTVIRILTLAAFYNCCGLSQKKINK